MTRHALVVCTANICRSPVVERLIARHLSRLVDIEDERWTVSSAGTMTSSCRVDHRTIEAAATLDIDISGHQSRALTPDILGAADLVMCMSTDHVRAVVSIDPSAYPRTFTLKELVRRASLVTERAVDRYADWLEAVSAGRRAAALIEPDTTDDLPDPYGRPLPEHVDMVTNADRLVNELVATGPWEPVGEASVRDVDRGSARDPRDESSPARTRDRATIIDRLLAHRR